MGNHIGKIGHCFAGAGDISSRYGPADIISDPHDGGFGHSFYYLPPDPQTLPSFKAFPDDYISPATIFRSISGASVSANVSTPLSTSLVDLYPYSTTFDRAAAFDCSNSFASVPLQPVPRHSMSGNFGGFPSSGPMERGFLSGPLAARSIESGPIDRVVYSGSIEKGGGPEKLQRSVSNGGVGDRQPKSKRSLIRILKRAISKTISRNQKAASSYKHNENAAQTQSSVHLSSHASLAQEDDGDYFVGGQGVQWAQGKAGEDRVHVVISEDNGWVFVGVYDGFNGPDAPDYLLANLYTAVLKELKGLIWNDKFDSTATTSSMNSSNSASIEEDDHGTTHIKTQANVHQPTENFSAENRTRQLMNVGDSRAIVAQQLEPYRDLERINEGTLRVLESPERLTALASHQLTMDHSTYTEEEVQRIKNAHPDDPSAIMNDRVKGYLKITRAFGAGFLKQVFPHFQTL